VNHFGDFRQPPMAGTEFTIGGNRPGNQQHQAWPQALTAGGEQVFSGGLEDWMTCADQTAQIRKKGIEVGLDRLEQLGNRGHDTSDDNRS
jgi:hypothetical protein